MITQVHPALVQQNYRKNVIINGDMRINQRSPGVAQSIGPTTSKAYGVDRFSTSISTNGQSLTGLYAVTQVSSAVNGFQKGVRVSVTTAETVPHALGFISGITANLEGFSVDHLLGVCTVGFWFKSNVLGQFSSVFRVFGLIDTYVHTFNNSIPGVDMFVSYSFDTTGKISVTDSTVSAEVIVGFRGTSFGGIVDGTWSGTAQLNHINDVNWATAVGNYIEVTGLQLEKGSIATDFDHRPFGEELVLCQRYYEKIELQTGVFVVGFINFYGSIQAGLSFSTTKRAIPTITLPPIGNALGQMMIISHGGTSIGIGIGTLIGTSTVTRLSLSGSGWTGVGVSSYANLHVEGNLSIKIDAEL